jgi:hypothetical protein
VVRKNILDILEVLGFKKVEKRCHRGISLLSIPAKKYRRITEVKLRLQIKTN